MVLIVNYEDLWEEKGHYMAKRGIVSLVYRLWEHGLQVEQGQLGWRIHVHDLVTDWGFGEKEMESVTVVDGQIHRYYKLYVLQPPSTP